MREPPHVDWPTARGWAEAHAQSWFDAPAEPLTVNGVPIGWPLQIEAFNAFIRVAQKAGRAESGRASPSLLVTAKRWGIDRAARANAMRALRLLSTGPHRVESRLLFVSEIPTPSMVEPSILVANAIPRHESAVAVADPRALWRWRRAGYRPVPLLLPWREERSMIKVGRAEARMEWNRFIGSQPHYALGGVDLTSEVLAALKPLVMRSAPWLAVELEALRRTMERVHPLSVAVASDQHRIGRLVVEASRGMCRAAVLQHGLPQTAIAFLPVVADAVCVWSEGIRDWFTRHDTPPERISVLGNPRLDELARIDRSHARMSVEETTGVNGALRLLVPLSPSDAATNVAVLDVVIAAMRRSNRIGTIVKLHPGQGENEAVRKRIAAAGLGVRIKVLRHESLIPLLLWADAVYLHRSTVAVEALAAGTPVVAATTGRPSIADDELRLLRIPSAGDADALVAAVEEIGSETGREIYLRAREKDISRMTGPIGGGAAERTARFLLAGAPTS